LRGGCLAAAAAWRVWLREVASRPPATRLNGKFETCVSSTFGIMRWLCMAPGLYSGMVGCARCMRTLVGPADDENHILDRSSNRCCKAHGEQYTTEARIWPARGLLWA